MKHFSTPLGVSLFVFALAGLMIGCAGNGTGGSVTTGGGTTATTGSTTATTGTTTGGTTFTLGGSAKVNGGALQGGSAAGTKTIVLADGQGNITTFSNILLPMGLSDSDLVTVIRAGSQLFKGTYSSTTAQCINDTTGVQASVPLNSDGTLAKDIAIDGQEFLVLPVASNGVLTFKNGIKATLDASSLGNNTKDVTVTVSSPATTLPSGDTIKTFNCALSFSGGGTANTRATYQISCLDGTQTSAMQGSNSTIPPNKSTSISTQMRGRSLPYTVTQVQYQLDL